MITYEKVRNLFKYHDDGFLIWQESRGTVKSGDIAGSVRRNRRQIRIDKKNYIASRLIYLFHHGYLPENEIDHKDRNTLNDRIENLREVAPQCNVRNRPKFSNNTSGVTGVSFDKRWKGAWIAYITIDRKRKNLGRFNNFDDAVRARWEAEKEYGFPNCCTTSTAYEYLKNQNTKKHCKGFS